MTRNNDRDSRYERTENKSTGAGEYGEIVLGDDDEPIGLIIYRRANAKEAWIQTDSPEVAEP